MAAREPRRSSQPEAGFSLGDFARIFRRRWRWFLVPTVLGMVLATVVALGMPAVYEASTTILIEPAKIPQDIVQTTVVQDKETRFENIRLRILARDNLSDLIDRFKLDPDDGTAREDLVAEMRTNITIEPIIPEVANPRGLFEINSMRIAFRSSAPGTAAKVANALSRDFIRQNMKQRAADAEGTSEFIAAELVRENKQIAGLADRIKEFKEEHLGSLPEQLETSRRTLEKLYLEMNNKKGDLDFATNQVNMLQAQLTKMRVSPSVSVDEDDPLQHKQALTMQLSQAQALGMTERHPTIKRMHREIAEMDKLIAARETQKDPDKDLPLSDPEQRLQSQLGSWQVKTVVGSQEVARLGDDIGKYEARIENTPRVAAELTGLEDRQKAMQLAIKDLERKAQMADIARSLELKQKGEKFRVIEQAVAPESPILPNRPLYFAIGTLLGLFSGLALVALRELRDDRLYTLTEVTDAIGLPILGSVPVIRLAAEIAAARRRVRRWGMATAAVATILLMGLATTWYVNQSDLTPSPEAPTAPASAGHEAGGDV